MDVVERGVDKRVYLNPQADWENLLNRPTLPIVRYNSTEYWSSRGDLVPEEGAIIIFYDAFHKDDRAIPGIKIGNGVSYLNNLPFINAVGTQEIIQEVEQLSQVVQEHTTASNLHVSDEDRAKWDNKIAAVMSPTDSEELILATSLML